MSAFPAIIILVALLDRHSIWNLRERGISGEEKLAKSRLPSQIVPEIALMHLHKASLNTPWDAEVQIILDNASGLFPALFRVYNGKR